MSKTSEKTVIGWSEYLDFPDWGIKSLQAKVDTGAKTSALHVENLKELDDGKRVSFLVVLSRKHKDRRKRVTADVLKRGRVRSSTGVYRTRIFVRTRIRIGDVEKQIDITLVSRERMIFRMLLGRRALEHDFLVDVSRRKALGSPPKKKKKKVLEAR
jgi:hypothetical protein